MLSNYFLILMLSFHVSNFKNIDPAFINYQAHITLLKKLQEPHTTKNHKESPDY